MRALQKANIAVDEKRARGAVAFREVRHPDAIRLALLREVELKSLLDVGDKAHDLDVVVGRDPQVQQFTGFFVHGNASRERMRKLLLEFFWDGSSDHRSDRRKGRRGPRGSHAGRCYSATPS